MPEQIIGQTRKYALAAPGANTNMLTTGLTPVYPVSAFRVTVRLATTSVFNLHSTDGTTAYVTGLNNSVALAAGDLYTLSFGVNNSLTYNFKVETDGIIAMLQVDEVVTGVI